MKKIDLRMYEVGTADHPMSFDVRASLVEVLFFTKINGRELLRRDDLARKIERWPDDDLLLEDDEWARAQKAVETAELQGREYAEFVRRIIDAQNVEVQERVVQSA